MFNVKINTVFLDEIGAISRFTSRFFKEGFKPQTLKNVEQGTARFNENMEAMKHNFLFRGYFRKQEKEKKKN
jgi:phospholipid/cholesterol/gamma-HCH transport system substrate-binding protein